MIGIADPVADRGGGGVAQREAELLHPPEAAPKFHLIIIFLINTVDLM